MQVLNDSYTMIPFMKENAQMKQQYRCSIDMYTYLWMYGQCRKFKFSCPQMKLY